MKATLGAAGRALPVVIGVALAWVGAFELNEWLFDVTRLSASANLVFVPAALRLIAVLLFNEVGALGLVIGAYLTTGDKSAASFLPDCLISISSGLAPLVAVRAGRRLLHISDSLSGLRPLHIVALSIACAGANSAILNVCLWLTSYRPSSFLHVLTVFIGDVSGAAIVLFLLSTLLTLVLPRSQPGRLESAATGGSPWG